MKKYNILFFLCILFSNILLSQEENVERVLISKLGAQEGSSSAKATDDTLDKLKKAPKNISFIYKDYDLVDVINDVAQEKDVNVILPTGADAIKSKLTITIPDKLTVDEAWNLLYTVLDVAGYTIIDKDDKGEIFLIKKVDNNIARQPMRIFISEPFNKIPDTDERILYIAYFENIQLPSETGGGGAGKNVVQGLLEAYLSQEVAKPPKFKFIPSANGVMMVDKASNIRAVVKILAELDKVEIKEHLEAIHLQHTSAVDVAKMFNDTILGKQRPRRFQLGARRKSEARYFEHGTRIVPEPRTNSLILVGNKEAIHKIKKFVFKYIDVAIESGKSILHRKKLQYMRPDKLKEVLDKFLAGVGEGVQARPGAAGGVAERFFRGVKIETDYPKDTGEGEEGKYKYYGTNSLLVAARSDDWDRLEKLIEKLDRPLKQVIVEVLIVDVRLGTNRFLGGQTRNPALAPLMQLSREGRPIEFQSAQLVSPVTEVCKECGKDSATLNADLMKKVAGAEKDPNPFLTATTAKSTFLTLSDKDGRTWSVLRLLSAYDHAKVLSHPYIVTVNNKEAKVEVSETRRLRGAAEQTAAGAAEVQIENVPAKVGVTIRPRVGVGKTVNMEVKVTIEEFQSGSPTDRFTREVVTNASVATDEILVLGGLIRDEMENSERRSPILGRIPILGWFFKQRSKGKIKNNLTVFIRPTVVEPQLRAGIGEHTQHYIDIAKQYADEGRLFEGVRDPVTRWFFKTEDTTSDAVDAFVEQHTVKRDLEIKLVDSQDRPDSQVLLAQNDDEKDFQNMEHVIVIDNDMLAKNEIAEQVLTENELSQELKNIGDISEIKIDASTEIDETLELAAQSAKEIENAVGHDKLKSLLQGAKNPLVM